jgi:hypothetical protein
MKICLELPYTLKVCTDGDKDEVLTAIRIRVTVFWDMTPYNW